MRHLFSCVPAVALALWAAPAWAQQPQKPVESPRVTKTFDPALMRRQAAQMAQFRMSLSDPDANVRLLTMREAISNGDPTQHEWAIEAGLASNETILIYTALRGILADTRQAVIEFLDKDGKPTVERGIVNFRLTIESFDFDNGRGAGKIACPGDPKWSGQLQGVVFSFNSETYSCSGILRWSADTGDFRGRLNLRPRFERSARLT